MKWVRVVGVLLMTMIVALSPVVAVAEMPASSVETTNAGDDGGVAPAATHGGFVDVDPTDLPGSGTSVDPYIITNASELQAMEDDLSASYRLGSDIDASGTANWNKGAGFDPIGGVLSDDNTPPAFNGLFDGAGHTIAGLTINRSERDVVGLFRSINDSGQVYDVALVNTSVTGSPFHNDCCLTVGGLVGVNEGTVRNASASGNVTGSKNVGGLIGGNTGTVRNASASGNVTGSKNVGGLVGLNVGTVRNASASSNVNGSEEVGGLVGLNEGSGEGTTEGTILESSASGNVIGSENVGGLVGWTRGTVREASASGNVTGSKAVGGLVGEYFNGRVVNSYYNVSKVKINGERKITLGALFGEQFQDWNADRQLNLSEYDSLNRTGDGVEITTVQGVKDALGFTSDPTLNWTLGEDIDLSEANVDLYIPYLAGSLDGNGHTLTVAVHNPTTSAVGAIGYNPGGEIANLSVAGEITGYLAVSGLVGDNNGIVRNASANVSVNGSGSVGGLVGFNRGTVREAFASGPVIGESNVGGLVGANGGFTTDGTVREAYWDMNATGQPTSDGGTGLTTAQMTGEAARTNMTGLAFGTVWETRPGDYPALINLPDPDRIAPAAFEVSGLSAPQETITGDTITVTATVSNIGDLEGTTTAEFVFAGDTLLNESLTLSAGDTTTVSFNVSTEDVEPGTYEHGVRAGDADQIADIEIQSSGTPDQPNGTTTPEDTDTKTPDGTTTPDGTETETQTPGGTTTPGDTDTETESSGQPGFGIGVAVVALLAVLALRRNR